MSVSPAQPMLRLVGARVAVKQHTLNAVNPVSAAASSRVKDTPPAVDREKEAILARRVATENVAASEMSPADARWVFAMETARRLEGNAQAILRPQRRRDLHLLATRIGLRPFDANLVIAIVQDAARNETSLYSDSVASTLNLVRRPQHPTCSVLIQTIIAMTLGGVGMAMVIAWVLIAPR